MILIGALFSSYVLYIIFATVISILEQLSINNELMSMLLEKEVEVVEVSGSLNDDQQNVSARKPLKKEELAVNPSSNNRSAIGFNAYVGHIIQKNSESNYIFETTESDTYLLKSNEDLEGFVGESVRVEGLSGGTERVKSSNGRIKVSVINVVSVEKNEER